MNACSELIRHRPGLLAGAMTVAAAIFISPMVSLLQLTEYAQSTGVYFLMSPGILLRILADVPSYVLYAARADVRIEDYACNDTHRDLSQVSGVRPR